MQFLYFCGSESLIFNEKFSPLPGFEPGTSSVPSQYATNWAILVGIFLLTFKKQPKYKSNYKDKKKLFSNFIKSWQFVGDFLWFLVDCFQTMFGNFSDATLASPTFWPLRTWTLWSRTTESTPRWYSPTSRKSTECATKCETTFLWPLLLNKNFMNMF